MNRSVYLYELDSVRNSEQEIRQGQWAMFEEIVKKGNTVVLSFNQLTDSEAFLCAIKDKTTYEQIVGLFKLGALKVSKYGKIRTPSQYVQNGLQKCIESGENAFLFSGLPVLCTDTMLLSEMQKALRYSSTSNLEELVQTETDSERIEQLEYIIRFIRMILVMSLEDTALNPAKQDSMQCFMDFYMLIAECLRGELRYTNGEVKTELKPMLPKACDILDNIHQEFKRSNYADCFMNNRTNWINQLNRMKITDAVRLAEAIIDLCYNYTIEDSIYNVSRHYKMLDKNSFQQDFEKRLTEYWISYRTGIHEFCKGDSEATIDCKVDIPPWDTALRVVTDKQKHIKLSPFEPLYEKGYLKEKKQWRTCLKRQMFSRLRTALIYILIFCGVDYLMGIAEDQTVGIFLLQNEILRVLWSVGCSTIAFGIVGSLVAEWFRLPDILESVKSIGVGVKDFYRIKNAPEHIAYTNLNQESGL